MTRLRPSVKIAAVALLLGAGVAGVWWHRDQDPRLTLEQALWVSDWDVTVIHGPGTPEQATVAERLRARGFTSSGFDAPILYRTGGTAAADPSEGMVMVPFDPANPRSALALKRTSSE